MLPNPSVFDQRRFRSFSPDFRPLSEHPPALGGGQKQPPQSSGLCGSLLASAGFPWRCHGEQTLSDSVCVEAVLRLQADTQIL